MITVDKAKALELVTKYAEAEPDKIVACEYVRDGRPECIVGNILINDLGFDLEMLISVTDRFGSDDYMTGSENHRRFCGNEDVEFTDDAVAILDAAQSVQDCRPRDAWSTVGKDYPYGNTNMPKVDDSWGGAGNFVKEHYDAIKARKKAS